VGVIGMRLRFRVSGLGASRRSAPAANEVWIDNPVANVRRPWRLPEEEVSTPLSILDLLLSSAMQIGGAALRGRLRRC